jgi:hypothetical protein
MSLKSESDLFIQTLPGLLCEGGMARLALMPDIWHAAPQSPKGAQGLREQAQTHMKAQRIGVGIAQILVMPSKPAGPVSWAQTSQQQAERRWHCAPARLRLRHGVA